MSFRNEKALAFPRRKPSDAGVIKKLLLTGIGLVLLVEVALWIFARTPRYWSFQHQLSPSIPGLASSVDYKIDERGMRHSGDPSKGYHIAVFGTSMTDQPLQNADQTWWGQLGKGLEEEFPGKSFPVTARAQRPFTGIANGAAWASARLDELSPDLVIVSYGFYDLMKGGEDYHFDPDVLSKQSVSSGFKEKLFNLSQIARRYRLTKKPGNPASKDGKAIEAALAQRRAIFQELPEISLRPGGDPLEEYVVGLKSFIKTCQDRKISVVVLGELTLHELLLGEKERRLMHHPIRLSRNPAKEGRPSPGWVEKELKRLDDAAEAICAESKVPFLSLNEKLGHLKSGKFFVDELALNDLGAKELAQELQKFLTPLLKKIPQLSKP